MYSIARECMYMFLFPAQIWWIGPAISDLHTFSTCLQLVGPATQTGILGVI